VRAGNDQRQHGSNCKSLHGKHDSTVGVPR
jgi:hypothetical protein